MTKSGIVQSSATLASRAKHPSKSTRTWRPHLEVGELPFVYSMVRKWAGKFKHGRESFIEDNPIQEDRTCPNFVSVSIFKFRVLKPLTG